MDSRAVWWHVAVILAVSIAYEALFLHHGIAWLFDEGWPLYAAMRLQAGGTLYADTFFLFPPGHLLPAYIAYALDPPGVVLARAIYALFTVALCAAIYPLGRRLMSPSFALFAALLVALAAPRSHLAHLLFGYRYLVFSVLALLALSAGLRTGERRFVFAAGLMSGVALAFRLTPAFAVTCGIAIALVSAERDWRVWLRDGAAFGAGLAAVALPLLAWFAWTVGLETLWRELVVRIIGLQQMQSKPVPGLGLPDFGSRAEVSQWFVAVQYAVCALIYVGYTAALAVESLRARLRGERFAHALLLAVVVWGGIYFLRTLGRSDEHHLTSAIPPACLLFAHLVYLLTTRWHAAAHAALLIALLGGWIFLQGVDTTLAPRQRGVHPLAALDGRVSVANPLRARALDAKVEAIRAASGPSDTILDLGHAPLIYVLTQRSGPGTLDIVMPGTFIDEAEERAFVARLERDPPALVLWPTHPFDGKPSRSIQVTAPHLTRWVRENYADPDPGGRSFIWRRTTP